MLAVENSESPLTRNGKDFAGITDLKLECY